MSDVSASATDEVKVTGDVVTSRGYTERILEERRNVTNERFKALEDRAALIEAQLAAEIKAVAHAAQVANDTLERLVTAKAEAIQKQTDLSFTMNNTAILKAEAANDKRFEGVNAFREQLSDQATKFASRESVELRTNTLQEQAAQISTRLTITETKAAQAQQTAEAATSRSKDYIALIIAGASMILALFNTVRIHW